MVTTIKVSYKFVPSPPHYLAFAKVGDEYLSAMGTSWEDAKGKALARAFDFLSTVQQTPPDEVVTL